MSNRIFLSLVALVFVSGCAVSNQSTSPSIKPKYKTSKCPTFDRRLSIEVKDYNNTYGLISWKDVSKIEKFLKAKKQYNANVSRLNKQ